MIKEKFQSVKTYISKHKVVCCNIGSSVVVAGITVFIMRKNPGLLCGSGSGLLCGSEARSFSFLSKVNGNQNIKAVTTIHTGSKGSSEFVTRNLDTGEVFITQGDAAKAFDIHPSILSSHLNGKFDTAEGHHFERLGSLISN